MDDHLFYSGPAAFSGLRNLYWHLRAIRRHDNAARVRFYRLIKAERLRLAGLGYSVEHLRLFCRYMSGPLPDCPALRRLWAYEQAVIAFSRVRSRAAVVCGRVVEAKV